MNNPAPTLSTLNTALAQTRAQMAVMESLRETGERLFSSICRGDIDSLGDILEARAEACAKLNDLIATSSPLAANLDQLAASSSPDISAVAAEILRVTKQMDILRMQILTRQNECEEALRAALADTSRQLREAAGQKKVRTAYQSTPTASPRYLDSRK